MAELLQLDIIQRYLRKNRRIYQTRRDYFAELLTERLRNYIDFSLPEGGMSLWAKFHPEINLEKLSKRALHEDLYFQDGSAFSLEGQKLNATRLGFASSTEQELLHSVEILKRLIEEFH